MCSRFVGKIAVVTASTKGIGFAIAKRLGQEGARIVISSRKEDNVRDAVSNLKKQGILVEGIACHVGKESEIDHLFKRVKSMYGGLDIFVSNAAANPSYGDLLKDRSGGCIILVSSIAGYIPMEMLGAYSVSKTSLIGMVKALVPGCAKRNIRVNGIAPGIIQTNFSSAIRLFKQL